jgi:hypothetical protein
MPWRELLLAVALSLLMYAVVSRVHMDPVLLRIAVRALLGVLVYGGLLLLVDPPVRRLARDAWQRLLARLA